MSISLDEIPHGLLLIGVLLIRNTETVDGISTLTALFATVFDPGISILYLLLYPKSTYTVLIFWGLERNRRF